MMSSYIYLPYIQLLVSEGEVRWLYTSAQSGQVVIKRKGGGGSSLAAAAGGGGGGPPEREVIQQIFLQAALSNPQNVSKRVAIVQQRDGM